MELKRNGFIKSAFIMSLATFIAKFLGAFYRIPLTNLLKSDGIGLYQAIFPVYALLLDFSGYGIPNALSKIIASKPKEKIKEYAKIYFLDTLKILSVLGGILSFLLIIFSKSISNLQGNGNAYLGYIFLAPSVFFVSLISCFRGYFQGQSKFKPSAVSQVTEQTVKIAFGLILVNLFSYNTPLKVGGATLAVTISELIEVIILFIQYKKDSKNTIICFKKQDFIKRIKEVIKVTVPVTITGTILPLSMVIDSFIIINVLKTYTLNATSLYGLYSGASNTIVNLPSSILYGISVAVIPFISSSLNQKEENKTFFSSMTVTLLLSVSAYLVLYFFSGFIVKILYPSLKESDKTVVINLIKLTSINVVFSSLLQTENANLIGKGKLYLPIIGMILGIIVKTVLSVLLLYNTKFNIYGAGLSSIACYFISMVVNFILNINKREKYENIHRFDRKLLNTQ